jgi:hypothetical protein
MLLDSLEAQQKVCVFICILVTENIEITNEMKTRITAGNRYYHAFIRLYSGICKRKCCVEDLHQSRVDEFV